MVIFKNVLSDEIKIELEKFLTIDELQEAIKKAKKAKAGGPTGLT